jgi:hypothetical protein
MDQTHFLDSMHPCLGVDEIFRFLAYELVASEAKASIVALACCCKSFEDPALDILWETQDRLLPLLKSLPGDVWKGDGCTVSASTTRVLFLLNHLDPKSFKRFPTTLEWARFREYARRMQMFRGPGDTNFLTSEVFEALQFGAIDELLFPNMKSLELWSTVVEFIPFISSFLSSRTTTIYIEFSEYSDFPDAPVTSMVTAIPALCPNLQKITLRSIPRDPLIVAAFSEFLLTTSRDTLRHICVDSPLTEEARQVVFNLPNLCWLWVVIEGFTPLPTMVLPNLTRIDIEYDHNRGWLQGFRGATLEKLNSVTFRTTSGPGDFLEEFQSVALTSSIQNTLSTFCFYTSHSWNPNYSYLLAFEQLTELKIEFSCHDSCSSRVDDGVIIILTQAMPKLEILWLGEAPCGTPTGVTFNGLITLACRCPQLAELCIHFRANSLVEATTSGEPESPSKPATIIPRSNCVLTYLRVGKIPIPEGSALAVALILLQVFPRILNIGYRNPEWKKVEETIELFKRIGGHVRHASKSHLPHLQ